LLTLVERTPWNMYLLQVAEPNQVFEIANHIYESGVAAYCHPNFKSNFKFTNEDPYAVYQWHLNNRTPNEPDLNVHEAWLLTQNCAANSPVVVAVIDDGLEAHEDLEITQGYTPMDTTGLGLTISNNLWIDGNDTTIVGHGMGCAGIIGAKHNKVGVKGIAKNVTLVPVDIALYRGATNYHISKGLNWAWDTGRADILSCSWGAEKNAAGADDVRRAIRFALTKGRNGLGSVVIFASGNTGGAVAFPADEPGVITVGGILKNGAHYQASGRGASMDVVAFAAEIVTTDRMGIKGLSQGNNPVRTPDYTFRFNGTSAACPQVSGIAALMLQVNPNLTAAKVLQYIQESAVEIPIRDSNPGFDTLFGYGKADARRAVERVLQDKLPSVPLGGFDNWLANQVIQVSPLGTQFCIGDIVRFAAPDLAAANIRPRWSVSPTLQILSPLDSAGVRAKVIGQGVAMVSVDFNLFACPYSSSKEIIIGTTPNPSPLSFNSCSSQYQEYYPAFTGGAFYYQWESISSGLQVFTYFPTHPYGNRIGILTTEPGIKYILRTSVPFTGGCAKKDTVVVNSLDCGVGGCRVFIAYPNPTSDELQLKISPSYRWGGGQPIDPPIAICKMENGVFTYQIRNIFAQTVHSGNLTDNETNLLSLKALKLGTYYLHVYFNGELLHSQQLGVMK
jgi:hypothetical protein